MMKLVTDDRIQTVGITGSDGFLAFHLRALFATKSNLRVKLANRTTFQDTKALTDFVRGCDVIIHFAGVNRSETLNLEEINPFLCRQLVDVLEREKLKPNIIFSSTTHIKNGNSYGRSKALSTDILHDFTARNSSIFANLILPHVFGEYCRPNYNSVVATLCHKLARGEQFKLEKDGEVNLIHAQDVAKEIYSLVLRPRAGDIYFKTSDILVSQLVAKVSRIQELYLAQEFPDLSNPLTLALFHTYQSYLFPHFYPTRLRRHADNRGVLVEAIKGGGGGQVFLSTTHPNVARGNHFHLNKVERFVVLEGNALVRLRRLFSAEVITMELIGREPHYIDIPTMHTHSIQNTGSGELLTLFWVNEIYDPSNSDTFAEAV